MKITTVTESRQVLKITPYYGGCGGVNIAFHLESGNSDTELHSITLTTSEIEQLFKAIKFIGDLTQ